MSVRFVLGRPGTGKTQLCLREISQHMSGTEMLYYLVPEQFSLQSEKGLTGFTNGAFTQVQALGFNRLAYHLFARMGGPPGKMVDDTGRGMLLRKLLSDSADALACYGRSADKPGFISELARIITEFNHYKIEPDDLLARASDPSGLLNAKLCDLALILSRYRATIEGRYLLNDETLTLLCKQQDAAALLAGGFFWLDGFTGFTPQELDVLSLMMQNAAHVTFTLTLRNPDDPLFETTRDTRRVLTALARSLRVEVDEPVWLETDYRHASCPALRHLSSHFQSGPQATAYADAAHAVNIVTAPDRHAEVYEAARTVWELVREKGYRFLDIGVLCCDRAAYEKLLRNAFGRLRIPLFVDSRVDVLSHPLTELIRAAIDIVARNWRYDSVFRFLKTRMAGLTQDEVDILENYVLAHGIKGYLWRYSFLKDETAAAPADAIQSEKGNAQTETAQAVISQPDNAQATEQAAAEAARLKTLAALEPLTNRLYSDKKETILTFCSRVFDMLYALNVPERLSELYAARAAAGDQETARAHKQIWQTLCAVFDKLVEMLGEEKVTVREFGRILDAGLSGTDLGLIPPSADQVFLGDIGRSRFPDIKTLIVLGANEGRFPPTPAQAGLFTEDERAALRSGGLVLAPELPYDGLFSLYMALCQPRESLVISYAENEPAARALKRIMGMFPKHTTRRAAIVSEYSPVNYAPPSFTPLSPETLKRLYGASVVTAASRMERFAECPFAYYVTYNLKAKERKIYQVGAADLGVVYHEVLADFSRRLADEGLDWGTLTREEISDRVERCVEAFVPEDAVLRGTARNRHVLRRVKRVVTASVWALSEHIRRGSFTPVGFELDFKPDTPVTTLEVRLNNQKRLILTGRIDRVDILDTEDNTCYVKIIDYKSGKRRFDLSEVLMGTQLQLMLYMNALLANGAALFGREQVSVEVKPGGVFYFHIDDPLLDTDDTLDNAEREERLLKAFRMSGLALPDAVEGMDKTLKERGGESLIIPVRINSDGRFGKSSSVMDEAAFEKLGGAVFDKLKELGEQMTEGVITPEPFVSKRRSACDYCRYTAVCGRAL